jgi:hypothetical protein
MCVAFRYLALRRAASEPMPRNLRQCRVALKPAWILGSLHSHTPFRGVAASRRDFGVRAAPWRVGRSALLLSPYLLF